MRTQLQSIVSLLTLASAVAAQGLFSSAQGQAVLGTGDPAPHLPSGTFVNGPDTPVVDLDGNLLFSTSLSGSVTTWDNRALYYGRTFSDLVLVARSGGPEPTGTMPGVQLIRYISATTPQANTIASSYRMTPQGSILWWGAGLSGPGIVTTGTAASGRNDSAYFWGPPTGQLVLVQRGMAAPSGGSVINTAFSSFSHQGSAMNAAGVCVFQVALEGGDVVTSPVSNAAALLIGTPGNLQWLVRRGDVLPVQGGTATIGTLGFNVQINEAGMVFHDQKLSSAAGTTTGSAAVTTSTDGLLILTLPGNTHFVVAREGDAAPGTAGASFNVLTPNTVGLTRSGRMGFLATLVGGDVNGTTNDSAIYTGTLGGGFQMLVRRGDTLPFGDTLATLMSSSISINDRDEAVFFGALAGPNRTSSNDQALLAGSAGNVRIVACEGDPTPGIPGATFGPLQPGSAFQNDRGQIVFTADVVTATSSDGATWAYDPTAGLVLLDRTGDIYTTAQGQQTSNGVSGGLQFHSGDGCPLTLNNNGDIVRRISTGNGTGVNVRTMLGGLGASPATVPSSGGTQNWNLDAGVARANQIYLAAGTLSGSRPGQTVLGVDVPLNNDFWFGLSVGATNSSIYTNSFGFLDGNGRATASWNLPAGVSFLSGALFHHAFVVFDPATAALTFVSQPASVKLD